MQKFLHFEVIVLDRAARGTPGTLWCQALILMCFLSEVNQFFFK
jgi:hypothetical protein